MSRTAQIIVHRFVALIWVNKSRGSGKAEIEATTARGTGLPRFCARSLSGWGDQIYSNWTPPSELRSGGLRLAIAPRIFVARLYVARTSIEIVFEGFYQV